MSVEIVSKHHQAQGAFDFGRIRENKPIGFPHERGGISSMSNLFYWAHAWSDTGGLIDTHPHQGFEIMSYVLGGKISHYDTKYDRWLDLDTGDAQVIRAGNGISHAEKVLPGGEFFQIWFDPDLTKTMKKEASYSDIKSSDFPTKTLANGQAKTIIGQGSPFEIDAEGIEVTDISEISKRWDMTLDKEKVYSIYVVEGEGKVARSSVAPNDFLVVKSEDQIAIDFTGKARLFIIQSPSKVSYKTYAEGQLI
ncbi:MAG: pirin family protein [Reichenbachiella sp.]|uniref:pirin family protein n=1 Tax=Reichenbachiella sp. TaxID=2184521 RepID=UPI0032999F9D